MKDGLEEGQGQAEVTPEGQVAEAPEAANEQPEITANSTEALGSFQLPDNWGELNDDQQAIYKSANAHYQTAFQTAREKDKLDHADVQDKAGMFDMLADSETRTRLFQSMGWEGQATSAGPQPTQAVPEDDSIPEYLDASDPKALMKFIDERAEVIAERKIAPRARVMDDYILKQNQTRIDGEFDQLCGKYPDARALRSEMAPLVDKAGISIPEAYAMVKTRQAMKDRGLDIGALVTGATPALAPTPPSQQTTPSSQTQSSGGSIDLDEAQGTKAILLAQAANGDETSIRLVKENGW